MSGRIEFFYIAAAIVILVKAWRGWRLGLVRQIVSLGALVVGTMCGIFGGSAAGSMLATVVPLPERLLSMIGGLALGMVVYFAITIVSAILFKKTGDQGVALVRIGYGFSGAIVGALYGVVLVCALAIGVRLLGSVGEAKIEMEKSPRFSHAANPVADALAVQLAEAKQAIDASAIGAVVRRVDPLPEASYSTLSKLATMVSNSKNIQRFMGEPAVRKVMNHPKVVALLSDPEVSAALSEHRYLSLLTNPRFISAVDDPEIAAQLSAVELEKAVDDVLEKAKGRSEW